MKITKRFLGKALSMLLVVCMVFSLCATVGFAAQNDLEITAIKKTVIPASEEEGVRTNVTVTGIFEGMVEKNVVIGLYTYDAENELVGELLYVASAKTDENGAFAKTFGFPDTEEWRGSYAVKANAFDATVTEEAIKPFEIDALGDEALLLGLTAKGNEGTVNQEERTAKVTVPNTTDLTSVAVTLELSPGAIAKYGNQWFVNGKTRLNFDDRTQTIKVYPENGDETAINEYVISVVKKNPPKEGSTVTKPVGDKDPTVVIVPNTPKPDSTPEPEVNFTDLGSVQWAQESIINLAKKGVVSGRGENTFDPDGLVTREEYAKLLVLAFGLTAENATCDFSDVSQGDWYYEYVAIAATSGVVNGMGNGTFGVGTTITRQDMAVMTYRAAMAKGKAFGVVNEAITFADAADISSYATEAVTVMQKAAIINGMGGNNFAPNGTATRAQAARIIDLATR